MNIICAAAVAAIVAFISSIAAYAQETGEGWRKVCNKQQDIDVCSTIYNVLSDTGQPLTSLNIIEMSGKHNEKRLAIQVPTGRIIPERIKLSVDGKAVTAVPYAVCNGPVCIADSPLEDTLLNAMRKGKQLTVTSVNLQGYLNPIDIPLSDFAKVYSGSGITDKDFQEEQDKVQKALQMRQKELEDKMKAMQDKAKTAQ